MTWPWDPFRNSDGMDCRVKPDNDDRSDARARRVLPRRSRRVGRHLNGDDRVGGSRRLALCDGVDVLHSLDYLAPDGVLIIEPGCVAEADEELAVAGIGILRAGHRDGAAPMLLRRELGF